MRTTSGGFELPEETLASGGRLAIVNRGATPYDRRASLVIDGSAGDVLARVTATFSP